MKKAVSEPPLDGGSHLKRRAQIGMIALAVRSVMQNLVILVTNVYLARLLAPADYGIFGMLQFAVSFFKLVGDTGLGAALIQKDEAPTDLELSSLFWFQIGLGVLLCIASIAFIPLLSVLFPSLPEGAQWMLPALALSLFFTMLRVVPFLVLERSVSFGWVGTIEFFGTIGFYGSAVLLASRGAGAFALVAASVVQAALVSVAANVVQPWRPKWAFSWASIRSMLKFGFAFQGNQIVNFANSAVTPLLAGGRLGKDAFGVIQFAQNTAWFPTLPVGIVRRVYFPFLSRLQNDRAAFVREYASAVVMCALPTFFFAGLFFAAAPEIVDIVYGEKWRPAVPAIYVYSVAFCFTFYSWIGSAALEALGQTSRLFRIVIIGAVTNWVAAFVAVMISPTVLSFAFGVLVQLVVTPIAVAIALRESVPQWPIFRRLIPMVVAAGVVGVVGRWASPWVEGPATLLLGVLMCAGGFLAVLLPFDPALRELIATRLRTLRLGAKSQRSTQNGSKPSAEEAP